MNRYASLYMANELNLLEIYSDKTEKFQVFKRSHAISAKLLEAVFKEKDFELNFCVALGLQKARQIFLSEVSRAAQHHISFLESSNMAAIAAIKRVLKGMSDAQN